VVTSPVRASVTASEPLVAVGPLYVSAGSAFAVRAALAGMLAINVVLALVALAVVRRRR
jgi:hypothetical protein